jgi:Tfp pilus assembly protein PilF
MLITISIILVVICLVIIALIIVKKFPALAILDVENIPGRKEAKFKEEILKKRLERSFSHHGRFFLNIYNFFSQTLTAELHRLYESLQHWQANLRHSRQLTLTERRARVKELLKIAEDKVKAEELDLAEQALIEIISLEAKNTLAFARLAAVYEQGKKWPEARQTWEYALKLTKQQRRQQILPEEAPALAELYFSLAGVYKNLDESEPALENIREALDIEPNNPRFLDFIIELALAEKNRDLAQEMLDRFLAINPENGKLVDWQAEIDNLKETFKTEVKDEVKNKIEVEVKDEIEDKTEAKDKSALE